MYEVKGFSKGSTLSDFDICWDFSAALSFSGCGKSDVLFHITIFILMFS